MKNIIKSLPLIFACSTVTAGDEICVTGISGTYTINNQNFSAIIHRKASNKQVTHIRFKNNDKPFKYAMFFDNGDGDVKILRGDLSNNSCNVGNIYINGLTQEYEYEITKKCPSRERRTAFNIRSLPQNYAPDPDEASRLLQLHRKINLSINDYLRAVISEKSLEAYNIIQVNKPDNLKSS